MFQNTIKPENPEKYKHVHTTIRLNYTKKIPQKKNKTKKPENFK